MQEKRVRASEKDLGLLERVAEQILRAKRYRTFGEEDTAYDEAASTLREMRTHLSQNPISFGKYYLLFSGDRVLSAPFYVSSKTGREFYFAPNRICSRLIKFKEYVPLFSPSSAISLT